MMNVYNTLNILEYLFILLDFYHIDWFWLISTDFDMSFRWAETTYKLNQQVVSATACVYIYDDGAALYRISNVMSFIRFSAYTL